MTGDSLLHMAEQVATGDQAARYGISPMSSVEIAEFFARADKAMTDPAARAMALRDEPLLLLLGAKGHESNGIFQTLKMIPGYSVAVADSMSAAVSVMMLSQLSDTRRPFYASEGKIMLTDRRGFPAMTARDVLDMHEFFTSRESMPAERRAVLEEKVNSDYMYTMNRDGNLSLRSCSALNDLIRSTEAYLYSAEGMSRMADMSGYFMAERMIIPMIMASRSLSAGAKEHLVKAIRYAAHESPTSAVHPYADLSIPGISDVADALSYTGIEFGKTGQGYAGSYATGEAAASISTLRGIINPIVELYVAPNIFSSGAIKALASMDGLMADFNLSQNSTANRELAMPRISKDKVTSTVAMSPQPLSSLIYEEGRLNPRYHDTGSTSLFQGVLGGTVELKDPIMAEGSELMSANYTPGVGIAGWRSANRPRLKNQDSVGRVRSITPAHAYVGGSVVPV